MKYIDFWMSKQFSEFLFGVIAIGVVIFIFIVLVAIRVLVETIKHKKRDKRNKDDKR